MNDILSFPDHDYPDQRIVIPLTETPVQQPAAPAARPAEGWPQLIRRIQTFAQELEITKRELQQTKLAWANDCADCAALQYELVAEREARTNAQIHRDRYGELLKRVLVLDEACTGDLYMELIAEIKSALAEVQS